MPRFFYEKKAPLDKFPQYTIKIYIKMPINFATQDLISSNHKKFKENRSGG